MTGVGLLSLADAILGIPSCANTCAKELVSAGERAIEVDHIFPRKHGGTDDLTKQRSDCKRVVAFLC
jgi:hypothetical protein